jgi:hypothetical protein
MNWTMSLDYAADHLTAAVRAVATSDASLAVRLQAAWDEHVQMVWYKPCLTRDQLQEFRDLWQRYTAPSDDRQRTQLRALTQAESLEAIEELVSVATRVQIPAARASGDERLATLADLDERGRRWRDHRQVINAILWRLRAVSSHKLPDRHGGTTMPKCRSTP